MRTPDWAGWMAVGRGNRGRLMRDDEGALAPAEAVQRLVAGETLAAGQSATQGCILGCVGAHNPFGEQTAGDSMVIRSLLDSDQITGSTDSPSPAHQ